MSRLRYSCGLGLAALVLALATPTAQTETWVVSWTGSAHGPYPSGNPVAQPVLDFAFPPPTAGTSGSQSHDQTFRLIIRPDLWGRTARVRFTNVFGTQPLTIDDAFVGLRSAAAGLVSNTNTPVTFKNGSKQLVLAAGEMAWSDPVPLSFVTNADDPMLDGRMLAVSFHTVGATGPMTWHAKALTTSYVTAPGAGSRGAESSDTAFPYTTTSWYFVDALEVMAPPTTSAVVCLGDSITDGTASTLNGEDRWPDVFSRRLHAAYGRRFAVVNAGIGGNRIVSPATYSASSAFAGGPAALDRLERDVLSLSAVKTVVWLEGINDLNGGATVEAIQEGIREGVRRMKARGLRVMMATITSALGNPGASGTADVDAKRKTINTFIRQSGLFDAVADFDAATLDPTTGSLKVAFQPNSSIGGAGDKLHPNRAGYQAMAESIDLGAFGPR